MRVHLTFVYTVDYNNKTVEFCEREYSFEDFMKFTKEINGERSEGTRVVEKNKYKADFVVILEDNTVLIPAEVYFICDLITRDLHTEEDIYPKVFNKYFSYVILDGVVFMLDTKKTCYGSWVTGELLDKGVLNYGDTEKLSTGSVSSDMKNVICLKGSNISMGFTNREYFRFLMEIAKES